METKLRAGDCVHFLFIVFLVETFSEASRTFVRLSCGILERRFTPLLRVLFLYLLRTGRAETRMVRWQSL